MQVIWLFVMDGVDIEGIGKAVESKNKRHINSRKKTPMRTKYT